MKRRKFIAFLGGAAAAFPLTAIRPAAGTAKPSTGKALPFCLSLWLAPVAVGVPVLDQMLGSALAVSSPVLDTPTLGIS